jgi:hypothetical protein
MLVMYGVNISMFQLLFKMTCRFPTEAILPYDFATQVVTVKDNKSNSCNLRVKYNSKSAHLSPIEGNSEPPSGSATVFGMSGKCNFYL